MKTIWPIKKLGKVCELNMGQSPLSSTYNDSHDGLPFYQGKKDYGEKYPAPRVWCSKPTKIVEVGDILISVRAPVGALNIAEEKSCIGRGLAGLRTGKELNQDFLFLFLGLKEKEIANLGTGSTFTAISKKHLENLEIPIPPLTEQKRIVAKLEKLFTKINEAKKLRAESLEATQNLLPAELHKLFEEGKKKFDFTELGKISTLVRGPFGGSLRKEIFVDSGDCVYEQGNVIKNNLKTFRYFITSDKYKEMERFAVSPGDILMSCSGTIGKFVIIPEKFKKGIINQALLKITPNKEISVDYLKFALQDYLVISKSHVKGMAIKNIAAVKELKKFKILLPPIAEQKKIVARLDLLSDKIEQLKKLQTETATDLNALEKSILHQAFEGEL